MTSVPPPTGGRAPSKAKRSRTHAIVIALSAVAFIAVIAVVAVLLARPAGTPTAAPTATATHQPKPVERPYVPVASVTASFPGWSGDTQTDAGTLFEAQTGDAKEGKIALSVSSTTAAGQPHRSITQTVAVKPATSYQLSAWTQSPGSGTTPVAIAADGEQFQGGQITGSNGAWRSVKWQVTTATGQTELHVAITVTGPVSAVAIDALALTSAKDPSVTIANASFETFSAPTRVTNPSLILTTGRDAIGVSLPADQVSWIVKDRSDKTVASGDTKLASHLGVIPLTTVPQGFYSIQVTQQGEASPTFDTTFMVLDELKGKKATDARFGVTVHPTIPQFAGYEPLVPQLGYSAVRMDATWASIETKKGQYDFPAAYDATYNTLAAEGVSVLPITDYRNKLYDGGKTPSTEAGLDALAAFSAAVESRYRQPSLEVYNEFNNAPMNDSKCGTTAACYIPMLQKAAAAVKAVNPETQIVGPAIAHKDDAWLTDFYKAGGLNLVDAVSFHPYDSLGAPEYLDASLQQAEARIKEYNNGKAKPIWLTELGWTNFVNPRSDQANYLVRAEAISFANGVSKFFWYDLVDHTPDPTIQGSFGLFSAATPTVPAFAPKQAAMTQAIMTRQIAGKEFASRDGLGETTYSYAFGKGAQTTRIAWATKAASIAFASSRPITVTDAYGKPMTIKPVKGTVTVPLGEVPVYVPGDLKAPVLVAGSK